MSFTTRIPDPTADPIPPFNGFYQLRSEFREWVGRYHVCRVERTFSRPTSTSWVSSNAYRRRLDMFPTPATDAERVYPILFWSMKEESDPDTDRQALMIGLHRAALNRLPGLDPSGDPTLVNPEKLEWPLSVTPDAVFRIDDPAWVWALLRALRDNTPLCDHPTDPTRTMVGLAIARLQEIASAPLHTGVHAKEIQSAYADGVQDLGALIADGARFSPSDLAAFDACHKDLEHRLTAFLLRPTHLTMPAVVRAAWERATLEAAAGLPAPDRCAAPGRRM